MIQDLLTALLLAGGVFFLVVAAIGLIRLPDVFCRLHVVGVIDTLAAPLILLGTAFHLGPQLPAVKLVIGILFIAITSPLVGHLLARAALEAGHRPGMIEESAALRARLAKEAPEPEPAKVEP
jgi:multicomponent Na+:H+ antiporter subunit G